MVIHARKRPIATVIMVVRDAEATLARAVESVTGQQELPIQIVLAALPSSDHTVAMCRRMAERDIHIDVIEMETGASDAAFDAALDAARGVYLMVLGQEDWLGPRAMEHMVEAAEQNDLELAVPVLSFDVRMMKGEVASSIIRPRLGAASTDAEFKEFACGSIELGTFGVLRGMLLSRDRIDSLGLRMSVAGSEEAFAISYIEDLPSAGSAPTAIVHLPKPSADGDAMPGAYMRGEREHARLLALARRWKMSDSPALMSAIHQHHLHQIEGCIESICAQRRLSSIERGERVRDILDAPSTKGTIEALGSSGKPSGLGIMYNAIASGNVPVCCLSARFSGLARTARLPFAPWRSVAV